MHHHHKPVFSGALTGAILNNGTIVSGLIICTVLNSPHDSSFMVHNPPQGNQTASYVGLYGTLVINHHGNWTYTLNGANAAVIALATGAHLTDSFQVETEYEYRGNDGPTITITITGH